LLHWFDVSDNDLVASFDEYFGEMASNEAAAACD
jgi:hypothetical protein